MNCPKCKHSRFDHSVRTGRCLHVGIPWTFDGPQCKCHNEAYIHVAEVPPQHRVQPKFNRKKGRVAG